MQTTIIRTVVLVLALFNQVMTMLGYNPLPVSEEQIYEVVSSLAAIAAAAWAWWKNNDFTAEAKKATVYLHELKAAKRITEAKNGK